MLKTRILILERDPALRDKLKSDIDALNWEILFVSTTEAALTCSRENPLDLIVLDSSMLEPDQIPEFLAMTSNSSIPCIILSAKEDTEEKIRYLEMGADIYLAKPFRIEELVAQIKSLFRKYRKISDDFSELTSNGSGIRINPASGSATLNGKEIRLTRTEYLLLRELISNKGRVIGYGELLNRIWGNDYGSEKEYLHVYINRLRNKIEPDPQNPSYLINHSGIGYIFKG